jgi:hypothetical protein
VSVGQNLLSRATSLAGKAAPTPLGVVPFWGSLHMHCIKLRIAKT